GRDEIRTGGEQLPQLDEHTARFLQRHPGPASQVLGRTRRLPPATAQSEDGSQPVAGEDAAYLEGPTRYPPTPLHPSERARDSHRTPSLARRTAEQDLEHDHRPHRGDDLERQPHQIQLPVVEVRCLLDIPNQQECRRRAPQGESGESGDEQSPQGQLTGIEQRPRRPGEDEQNGDADQQSDQPLEELRHTTKVTGVVALTQCSAKSRRGIRGPNRGGNPAVASNRTTLPRCGRKGSRSSSIRSSVPRACPVRCQATRFLWCQSPTETASG